MVRKVILFKVLSFLTDYVQT